MNLSRPRKRICLFCFYDSAGIVDSYVQFYLKSLQPFVDFMCIVCNGMVTPKGKEILREYADELIFRPNKGFDAWAHRTAINKLGWKKIGEYDELIVTNTTVMGPVRPLSEMFDQMDLRKDDFWGITKHFYYPHNSFHCEYDFIPEHIQSYFMVFRKSVLTSDVFKSFWKKLPQIYDYNDAVGKYELVLTKNLSDAGYTYSTFVDVSEYEDLTPNPIADYPMELIRDHKCPFFKRRAFFNDFRQALNTNAGQQGIKLYRFLAKEELYDMNMFWQNMLRTVHMIDLVRNISLLYVLPNKTDTDYKCEKKVALGMHLYYPDLFERYLRTILCMPSNADIYITTDTSSKKAAITEQIEVLGHSILKRTSIYVVGNRGRDMAALWVALRENLAVYDYVCFLHDKKTRQISPGSIGESWAYKLIDNVLGSPDLVQGILQLFDSNERLGMLVPPPPIHGQYLEFSQDLWTTNFDNTMNLAKKISVQVPMDPNKEPVSAIGNCFWFKTAALKELFKFPWKYEDFPAEPLAEDGTISHAMERIYPYVAQNNGFYSGWVLNQNYASTEFISLYYYLSSGYTPNTGREYISYLEREVRKYYQQTSLKWQLKHRICKLLNIKEKPLDLDEKKDSERI